jgi:hypothetical protein
MGVLSCPGSLMILGHQPIAGQYRKLKALLQIEHIRELLRKGVANKIGHADTFIRFSEWTQAIAWIFRPNLDEPDSIFAPHRPMSFMGRGAGDEWQHRHRPRPIIDQSWLDEPRKERRIDARLGRYLKRSNLPNAIRLMVREPWLMPCGEYAERLVIA